MHSQLSIDERQKLVNIFQKGNEENDENLEIIVKKFQMMKENYTLHRAGYVIIMKSQFSVTVKNQVKKRAH